MRRATAILCAAGLSVTLTGLPGPAEPARGDGRTTLDAGGECDPTKPIPGRPWPLQRVPVDRLWQESKGRGVQVAVIDSGVDDEHGQLKNAVDAARGKDLLRPKKNDPKNLPKGPTVDLVGHGTKVAGIIAARPTSTTGFVGLAPEATIIPIRQNDGRGEGNALTLAQAVRHAVAARAKVINISQDTDKATVARPDSALRQAVEHALENDVVVIASVGNDGADGKVKKTYPAAYEGVLAVAASDRNNERALFSQRGDFVGVAAPGVDIVSTVPGGGQCVDNGTSFAAPYVSAVAALIRAKHPDWKQHQVVAQIQQTAERAVSGPDRHVGWGVVDPLRALTEDAQPLDRPVAREGLDKAPAPEAAELTLQETYADRNERLATYALLSVLVIIGLVGVTARIARDRRRR